MYKRLKIIYPNLKLKMFEYDNGSEDIAKIINATPSSTRRKLKGEFDFKLKEALKISKYYNMSIDELFKT